MNDFIREFDYFGYTPQFLISGEIKYKSKLGGLTFFLFLIFALFYFTIQLNSFVKNMYNVDNSRDILRDSLNYNLTTELYFGGLY